MDNKELFEDYEITGWQISPKTYKFLGIAAALNIFAILIVGQFNLLQTKACDSPYVGKVCQVLDIVSLGSELAGTDPNFVDKEYDPTVIEEGDITYIDVSGQEPPFTYPEGYFAVANPPSEMMNTPTDFGSFTPTDELSDNASPLGLPPQVLPTPNDKVANQTLPDSPFDFSDSVKTPPVKNRPYTPRYPAPRQPKRAPAINGSPSKLPKLPGEDDVAGNSNKTNGNSSNTTANANTGDKTNTNATAQAESEEDKNKFNSKPLKDFGDKYGEQILKKEVDINAPFTIEVIAKLDENGKLINPKMQPAAGSDPKMIEVATAAIGAFSDTHLLKPLYDTIQSKNKKKGKDINIKITFSQDKDNLQAVILTETESEDAAKSIQSTLNLLIKGSTAFMREGSDEAALMSKANLATQGKIFIINFLMPNDEKTQLIEKSLKGLEEKKSQPSSNSTAAAKDTNAK